ncbi:MAG: hypothetical protein J6V32_04655 [Elusimicrobiaceae bacterium]|nr:hypothetical protein [Elusimicrobiaceae bacterium]
MKLDVVKTVVMPEGFYRASPDFLSVRFPSLAYVKAGDTALSPSAGPV